jgi:hypothetical protein
MGLGALTKPIGVRTRKKWQSPLKWFLSGYIHGKKWPVPWHGEVKRDKVTKLALTGHFNSRMDAMEEKTPVKADAGR